MSSHPRRRKDSSGAGTSQDDSKDLLSGKNTNSMANHKFFAKPLHTCSYLLTVFLHIFRRWWSNTHTLRQVKFDDLPFSKNLCWNFTRSI